MNCNNIKRLNGTGRTIWTLLSQHESYLYIFLYIFGITFRMFGTKFGIDSFELLSHEQIHETELTKMPTF